MPELESTTIVPIAFYCFFLGVYFLSFAVNSVLNNNAILAGSDYLAWLPVLASTIFAAALVIVGFGILHRNNMCWKVLFFSLAICISSVAALIIIFVVFLFLGNNLLFAIFHGAEMSSVTWFSFLSVFLSEIIVFYYLTREEVVTIFGGMGDILSPF